MKTLALVFKEHSISELNKIREMLVSWKSGLRSGPGVVGCCFLRMWDLATLHFIYQSCSGVKYHLPSLCLPSRKTEREKCAIVSLKLEVAHITLYCRTAVEGLVRRHPGGRTTNIKVPKTCGDTVPMGCGFFKGKA